MSFSLAMGDILQYAYNIFASALPIIYLFLGATFGAFVLAKILGLVR